MRNKGQAFVSDFTVSIAVFSLIVVAFYVPWNSVIEADGRFSEVEEMKSGAERTASLLVTTPGYPEKWEEEGKNVSIPGFATEDNLMSTDKILRFANMSNERQRSLVGGQQFYLVFRSSESIVKINGTELEFGKNPLNQSNSPATTVAVNRDVLINKSKDLEPANMVLSRWRKKR